MTITREQVADLREGDVVEMRRNDWPEGTIVRGPLRMSRGVLVVGSTGVRYASGEPAGFIFTRNPWTLTVVSRAPRLYVNSDRTEPVPGDVVRVETGEPDDWYVDVYLPRRHDDPAPWVSLYPGEAGARYPTDEALPETHAQGRSRLLVDGSTGQSVPS